MASSVSVMHPSRLSWSAPIDTRTAGSPRSSRRGDYASLPVPPSPRLRRVRMSLFFAVIGIYAVSFIVWCSHFHGEHGRGLAALFPKGYDEKLNRMLGLDRKAQASVDTAAIGAFGHSPRASDGELECLGWRHTDDCDPMSFVLQSFNRSCDFHVRGGQAGYCAMRNRTSGLEMRVMRVACSSIPPDTLFTCDQALDFVQFREETKAMVASDRASVPENASAENATAERPAQAADAADDEDENVEDRGILMVIYPKLLVSAYATVRTLRSVHNCTLPIELWYIVSEMGPNGTQNAILQELQAKFAPISLVAIQEQQVAGFNSKVHALLQTNLTNILFLDADNLPVRNPTYLFETPEFQETGALFWPDFWHPAHSIFNINRQSLLWELLDLDFVDMFEQESGQLVINKKKSAAALQLLAHFAFRKPNIFERLKLAWGDKDLFRLAWLKSNTSFHMIATPPGIAGSIVQSKFCGMTMAQFDPSGHVVFLHRNAMKLNGGRPPLGKDADSQIWTHLQTFEWHTDNVTAWRSNATITAAAGPSSPSSSAAADVGSSSSSSRLGVHLNSTEPLAGFERLKELFRVIIYNGAPQFPPTQWCYGKESPPDEPNFRTIPWRDTPFPDIELQALAFAKEGVDLLPDTGRVILAST